jgi:lysozyme family protein
MKKKKRIIGHVLPTVKKKVIKSSIPTAMEYLLLFNSCKINKHKLAQVDKAIDENITVNRSRYEGIANLVRLGNGNLPLNQGLFASGYTPFFDRYNSGSSLTSVQQGQQTVSILNAAPALRDTSNYLNNTGFFDSSTLQNSSVLGINNYFSNGSTIPWYFIACVHYLECSFSFKKHLHNGDPLSGYTIHVPVHRPKVGHGAPFTFEESAVDALKLMNYDKVTNWSLPFILQKLEGYNGFGYTNRGINSPYLWSYSNQYVKGKYTKDRTFSANAVSEQMGAAVILKRMEDRALISIPRN